MISHPAILAIVINNFSFHYGFYIIMNWLPTYFNKCVPTHSCVFSEGWRLGRELLGMMCQQCKQGRQLCSSALLIELVS
jgi:hypothetical protein